MITRNRVLVVILALLLGIGAWYRWYHTPSVSVVAPAAKKTPKPKPTKKPAAGAEKVWANWNVAPYALSLQEVCRKMPQAIDGFDRMPEVVKESFKDTLGVTCEGGVETWLKPDQALQEMWSGGKNPHVMNNITVGKLPVLTSPDGRPYREGSVAETAKALMWTQTFDGKTYVLYIPFVCFNVSWGWGECPVEECVEIEYDTVEGEVVEFGVIADNPLPASSCFLLKAAGDDQYRTPPTKCLTGGCNFSAAVLKVGKPLQHSGGYVAHTGKNFFRFPAAVARAGTGYLEAFCKQFHGRQTMGVGVRWVHFVYAGPRRAIIYDSPNRIPPGLSADYDLAWRWRP